MLQWPCSKDVGIQISRHQEDEHDSYIRVLRISLVALALLGVTRSSAQSVTSEETLRHRIYWDDFLSRYLRGGPLEVFRELDDEQRSRLGVEFKHVVHHAALATATREPDSRGSREVAAGCSTAETV